MASFLLYWKYFWRDMAEDPNDFDEIWHTKQENAWRQIQAGDLLWVITNGGVASPGEWRLLHKIIVRKKSINRKLDRPFKLEGDSSLSQRFDPGRQSDLTPVLQLLQFRSGKPLLVTGSAIGNAIQAIRPLTDRDERLLSTYSRVLVRHPTDAGHSDSSPPPGDEQVSPGRSLSGAGFGDPDTNRRVEQAAIKYVTDVYRKNGWTVESVEAEKCGFDLLCTKATKQKHIEVKGIRGAKPSFIITRAEVRTATSDPKFFLAIVTSALSKSPTLKEFSGRDFNVQFSLDPLAYIANMKQGFDYAETGSNNGRSHKDRRATPLQTR